MKYRDTETGKIWDEIDLLAEYIENAAEIKESSGARNFSEWLRNATSNNGFLEEVKEGGHKMKRFEIMGTDYYVYECTAQALDIDDTKVQDALLVISKGDVELHVEVYFGYYSVPETEEDFAAMLEDYNACSAYYETLETVRCPELGSGPEPWRDYVW